MFARKLSKIRSKVVSSQKDRQNAYTEIDISSSIDNDFESVRGTNNSTFISHPMEDEHNEQSQDVSHAELWFPTQLPPNAILPPQLPANAIMPPLDFSYEESQTSETNVSLETSSVANEDIDIGPPVLPPYEDAEEQFLEDNESYFEHLAVDNIRSEQYPKLGMQRLAYLDYANFALYSQFQVEEHMHILLDEGPYLGSTSLSDASDSQLACYIDNTGEHLLQLFNTSKDDYSIIFTNGLTGGYRVFSDIYPFKKGGLLLICQDTHESVKHTVQTAAQQGARLILSPVGELDLGMHGPELRRLLRKQGGNSGGTGLFIYPSQSCLSGVRHSLNWIIEAQQNGWQVLLDVATYLPLGKLDLSLYQPEFVIGSFHHMLGYPSGGGFLLVNRKCYSIIKANSSNHLKLMASPEQGRCFHVVSEDDSINLLTFAALSFGLEHLETIGQTALLKRSESLVAWLFKTLKSLKHKLDDRLSLLKVYGSSSPMYRGSIISFNVMDSTGNILPASLIQRLAAKENIVVGAGNFRNPGLASVLSKSQERISVSNMFDKEYNFTAVRVSLGPVSTFEDVYRLVQFLSRFRDEDYMSVQAMGFMEESAS